jgi:hypothetical protein
MTERLEKNKKNVMAFYDLMFNQNNPTEAIKRYVGEAYRRLSLTILRGWQKSILENVFTSSV